MGVLSHSYQGEPQGFDMTTTSAEEWLRLFERASSDLEVITAATVCVRFCVACAALYGPQSEFIVFSSQLLRARQGGGTSGGGSAERAKERIVLSRAAADIDDELGKLDASLSEMEARPRDYSVTAGELNRRRHLLSQLRQRMRDLNNAGKSRRRARRGGSVEETAETKGRDTKCVCAGQTAPPAS
jgi:hypothetical protein